ncbi:phosphate ABC transporter substrate-binding protein [Caldisalinibacter kiritimatiensis]|uniref:Phosphate-binding protein n=1 Tax=Caldisalinibacter kiritimatiensis TaxID=1304284 RepID=R1CY16_9FIRM|nr:phosphate ABC transporter substrate-binding protein [Caldisalinibacter kiritimatiensis]EOD01474.1 Phosphate ABC transporter, periplasmic phosphate-binding protein PstS [Caldisalinibacter kiritimatiensis]
MRFLTKSKLLILVAVLVLSMSVFAACSQDTNTDANTSESNQSEEKASETKNELEGNIVIAGSTSVTPTAEKVADAFMERHPNVKIQVQGIGSSAGVKAAHEGACDIGMASRNLKAKEEEWGLTKHVIAYDGIAVIVHPNNKVGDLTKEQVQKIFKGEIKNWKEVGGEDHEIVVISRESGSGTRGAFEEIVGLEGEDKSLVREDALIAEGNGAVRANVSKKEYAIGYISLSYLNDSVKGVKINGVEPTVENIKAEKYPIYRPFLMITNGEMNELVKAYMDFMFSSEGQEIVAEKCIPVK